MASTANFTFSLKFFKKSVFFHKKTHFCGKKRLQEVLPLCTHSTANLPSLLDFAKTDFLFQKGPIHLKGQTTAGQYKMNRLTLEVGIAKREVLVLLPKGVFGHEVHHFH